MFILNKKLHCICLALIIAGAFGTKVIKGTIDLKGKSWVRFEAWDIAANGVISQPLWLK